MMLCFSVWKTGQQTLIRFDAAAADTLIIAHENAKS